MPNRLASETSPYLLQHAANPVDWHPWGPEALARARALDRPLLVSIGYAACHWCHVMAHESFEDPDVAALMNDAFVCVKVDREERPDIDAVCMDACQRLTGHGGWPLNVFMTPDQRPFFAGTYFPPEQRGGMASWPMVLVAVANAWADRRETVDGQAAALSQALSTSARAAPAGGAVPASVVDDAVAALHAGFDERYGGFGGAPKFPPHCVLEFLLSCGVPDGERMALATLRAMAAGGIFDQIGGGFARYTVDGTWTVPHFEKMLYDNALLARAYLHGWQLTGEPRLRDVCEQTLDFCMRELRGPEGGFCSSLDADSEGAEGRFYVWTRASVSAALEAAGIGSLGDEAFAYFGLRPGGNFEDGLSVLRADGPVPARLPEIRAALLAERSLRVRPGLDDKRLLSWNALMVSALAEAGAVISRPEYVDAAVTCAAFLLDALRDGEGRLLRTWKDGRAHLAAYLEDHAYLVQALVTLYEATFDPRWYTEAVAVADAMIARFGDAESGGFFTTASDQEALLARRRDLEDAPIPSGSSAAALGLLRLARLAGSTGDERWAVSVLRAHGPLAVRHPSAFGHLLCAVHFYAAPVREVAIVDEGPGGPLARAVRTRYRPWVVLAGSPTAPGGDGTAPGGDGTGPVPLLEHRGLVDGRPAAYVCERFACQAPVTDPAALAALLDGDAPGS